MNHVLKRLIIVFFLLSSMISFSYAGIWDDCRGQSSPIACVLNESGDVLTNPDGQLISVLGNLMLIILFSLLFFPGVHNFMKHKARSMTSSVILGILVTAAFNFILADRDASPALLVGTYFLVILTFAVSLGVLYYGSKWIFGQKEEGVKFANIFKLLLFCLLVFVVLYSLSFVVNKSFGIMSNGECNDANGCDKDLGFFLNLIKGIIGFLALVAFFALVGILILCILGVILFVLFLFGLPIAGAWLGYKGIRGFSDRLPSTGVKKDLIELDNLVFRGDEIFKKADEYLKKEDRGKYIPENKRKPGERIEPTIDSMPDMSGNK